MSGVELIVAAMAAGASAGITRGTIRDAYGALRDALRRRLTAHGRDTGHVLETDEVEPAVWQARLAAEVHASGADRDEEVLNAARVLLHRIAATDA